MSEALWALGRGTGVVALVLMTITVVLGILTRSGRPAFGMPRFAVTLVHRNSALIGTVFIAIHVISLLFDPYAQLKVLDFFVPFLGSYRPFWLGLGTVAADLLIAVVVTSLLRHRLGQRAFRAVHWATYALWPIALFHSIGTGTDAGSAPFILLAVVCIAAVTGSVIWRLTTGFQLRERATADRRIDPARIPVDPNVKELR
ncbi:ferric reductase-like transmembrane domain-containing protein [Lysinimonas soli]|uniref:Ferric reductase-like transmembrane domain-containing protein n=1 Tax=Lysinimonas soli TaxID=1074233 RepID=A0ABW0NMI6_9MICO